MTAGSNLRFVGWRLSLFTFTTCVLILVIALVGIQPARAQYSGPDRPDSKFTVGMVMPGVSVGYQISSYRGELRYYHSDQFKMQGFRGTYRSRFAGDGITLYTGLEAYRTQYHGVITKGTGRLVGVPFGMGVMVAANVNVEVDYTLASSRMTDDYSGVTTSEFVHYLNAGVQYEF